MGEVKGPLQTAVELGKGCPLYGRDRLLTFYSTSNFKKFQDGSIPSGSHYHVGRDRQ